jgi:membrane protein
VGAVSKVDDYQRAHRWLGLPLAVVYKFVDDQGTYLAAIVTHYALLSLFPLLLLLVTILGYLLRGDTVLQQQLVHSALGQFPIVGNELQRSTHAITGDPGGIIVGVIGAVYGGLGVIQAAQNAFDRAYAVPRQDRPDPLHSRLRSLILLPVLGVAVALTTALSGFSTSATSLAGVWGKAGVDVLSLALNVAVFVAAFRILTARVLTTRDVLPGAVFASVGWQVLQSIGTLIIEHELKGSNVTAGTFGLVIGLIVWIYLVSVIIVLGVELNVVIGRRLYPRALLALVSDTGDLTRGDKEAYRSYSRSERYKSFQEIDVTFGPKTPPGAATPAGDEEGAYRPH